MRWQSPRSHCAGPGATVRGCARGAPRSGGCIAAAGPRPSPGRSQGPPALTFGMERGWFQGGGPASPFALAHGLERGWHPDGPGRTAAATAG
eukprot:3604587-Lingulodinium_polyedra.AAC.1